MAKPVRGEPPDRDGLEHQDVEAALAARSELGPAYEPAIVESLAERIETAIEARVDARMEQTRRHDKLEGQRLNQQMVIGIVSLGTGIPITGIAAGATDGVVGIAVVWAGIAAVNVAHAVQGWRRRG
jgi:hypothetical protein